MPGVPSPKVSCHYLATSSSRRRFALMRRAFDEFLALPTAIFCFAILLALGTLGLDGMQAPALVAGKHFILHHLFRTEQGTHDFLSTLLAGLLTLISITFSILLLAVQQTASSLSNQVYDQFLRRTANQVFLGYAVGLAVNTLIVLAAVGKGFNPVYSACTIVLFAIAGLGLLIVLIYGTIYQMRPVVIIEAMHDHILLARQRQQHLVDATRRESQCRNEIRAELRAKSSGFFQDLRIGELSKAFDGGGEVEVVIRRAIGTYLARDDTIAVVKAASTRQADEVVAELKKALVIDSDRDLGCDPAWGIIELESVAWTTVSSAKSTPEPPRLVINALRDIFTRWAQDEGTGDAAGSEILPIVYHDDVRGHVLNALATIAAGANESLQHVVMIEALNALRSLFVRVSDPFKPERQERHPPGRAGVAATHPDAGTGAIDQVPRGLDARARRGPDSHGTRRGGDRNGPARGAHSRPGLLKGRTVKRSPGPRFSLPAPARRQAARRGGSRRRPGSS